PWRLPQGWRPDKKVPSRWCVDETGSQIGSSAQNRILAAITPANLTRDHQTGIDTKMETKLDSVSVIERNNRVHHIKSGPQGTFGIIFMRHRRAKNRHDFIADELVHHAVIFLYHRH